MAKHYFSHDFNARLDPKLLAVRCDYGMEGIGIYWCMVEILYEQGGYVDKSALNSIAYELHVDKKKLETILTKYKLFRCVDKKYHSTGVLKRLEKIKEKTQKARDKANKRWEKESNIEDEKASYPQCNSNTTAMPQHNNSNAPAMPQQCKSNQIKLNNDDNKYILITTSACAYIREDVKTAMYDKLFSVCSGFLNIVHNVYGDTKVFKFIIEIIATCASFSSTIYFGGTTSPEKTIEPSYLEYAVNNNLITPHNIAHINTYFYEQIPNSTLNQKAKRKHISDPVAYVLTTLVNELKNNDEWKKYIGGNAK